MKRGFNEISPFCVLMDGLFVRFFGWFYGALGIPSFFVCFWGYGRSCWVLANRGPVSNVLFVCSVVGLFTWGGTETVAIVWFDG